MMKVFAVLSLYIVFALILGILAFVLKKRHTRFPDFTVGYHDKRVMENKEKWECANHTAGNLCAFFALISDGFCFVVFRQSKCGSDDHSVFCVIRRCGIGCSYFSGTDL